MITEGREACSEVPMSHTAKVAWVRGGATVRTQVVFKLGSRDPLGQQTRSRSKREAEWLQS